MSEKSFFIEGPITAEFVAETISKHSNKTQIGGHDIFLGQVRSDVIDGKIVKAIDYSAYVEMADKAFQKVKDKIFSKYNDLICMHISHSIGIVNSGEISLMVFVSCGHRKQAFDACHETVNLIKANVPIWGREVFEDDDYAWKVNM